MKPFLGSFVLPAFLLASTAVSANVQDGEPCRPCLSLPNCLLENPADYEELWDCMANGNFGPPPGNSIADIEDWCCEKCFDVGAFFDLPYCQDGRPTDSPSKSPAPSTSPSPTFDCAGECCDCIHTCTIQQGKYNCIGWIILVLFIVFDKNMK